jgi:hypothetical protein
MINGSTGVWLGITFVLVGALNVWLEWDNIQDFAGAGRSLGTVEEIVGTMQTKDPDNGDLNTPLEQARFQRWPNRQSLDCRCRWAAETPVLELIPKPKTISSYAG